MISSSPQYSVVVPVYNSEATVAGCLQALLRQTIPLEQYEILVVDDGSTDGTFQQVAREPRVRLIHQSNAGPAAARNHGARHARGSILIFTDADCRPAEDWLEKMARPFEHPEVVGVKGTYKTDQLGLVSRFVQLEYETKYDRMSRLETIDFIDTYSAAYRKPIFLANGGFEELFRRPSVEDQEFSFRLARKGYQLVFQRDAVVFHSHDRSIQEYAIRKLGIGYWKAVMLKWLPEKMLSDSHTLPSQKIQILLLGVMVLGLVLGWLGYPMLWFWPVIFLAFFAVDAAFIKKILAKDAWVLSIAPILLLARAAALGLGLLLGSIFLPGKTRAAEPGLSFTERAVKRTLDVIGGGIGLVVSLPVIIVVGIAIRLDSPGPVFFTQLRAGENGRPFRILKLRTMVADAPSKVQEVLELSPLRGPVYKIPNDPRVTRVGRLLRRWSLDELPQFWNVLAGEMSLVGPRPEELSVVQQYNDTERRRLLIKPGLTGPMQVNGRGDLNMDERLKLEMAYIENYSLWNDVLIMISSLPVIIVGKGAY